MRAFVRCLLKWSPVALGILFLISVYLSAISVVNQRANYKFIESLWYGAARGKYSFVPIIAIILSSIGYSMPWIIPALTATTIAGEQEIRTLELLRLTPLSNRAIITKKLWHCIRKLWPGILVMIGLLPLYISWAAFDTLVINLNCPRSCIRYVVWSPRENTLWREMEVALSLSRFRLSIVDNVSPTIRSVVMKHAWLCHTCYSGYAYKGIIFVPDSYRWFSSCCFPGGAHGAGRFECNPGISWTVLLTAILAWLRPLANLILNATSGIFISAACRSIKASVTGSYFVVFVTAAASNIGLSVLCHILDQMDIKVFVVPQSLLVLVLAYTILITSKIILSVLAYEGAIRALKHA